MDWVVRRAIIHRGYRETIGPVPRPAAHGGGITATLITSWWFHDLGQFVHRAILRMSPRAARSIGWHTRSADQRVGPARSDVDADELFDGAPCWRRLARSGGHYAGYYRSGCGSSIEPVQRPAGVETSSLALSLLAGNLKRPLALMLVICAHHLPVGPLPEQGRQPLPRGPPHPSSTDRPDIREALARTLSDRMLNRGSLEGIISPRRPGSGLSPDLWP